MAVREPDGQQIVGGLGRQRGLRRRPEPPPEAVLAPLEALGVGRAVLAEEEARARGEPEEVVVQRRGERGLAGEHERRGAPDRGEIGLAELDELRQLPDEAWQVRRRQPARHGASVCPAPIPLKYEAGMLDTVRQWIDAAERIVALTGAGISTDSGIPDFRGPQGVWTKDPKAENLSDIRAYMSDPDVRRRSWHARLDHAAWRAQPNAGHVALAALERRGILHALITQNIDGLHQLAGNSPDRTIEVHGTMRDVVCMACGWLGPMPENLARGGAGEDDPPCR